MILLSLLLAALGATDLVRPENRASTRTEGIVGAVVGGVVLALLASGLGIGSVAWAVIPVGLVLLVAWILLTPVGVIQTDRPWPVAGLAVVAIVALAVPQPPVHRGWLVQWYDGLDVGALADVSIEQFVLGAACVLFLIETANIIVRLMLIGTGPSVIATEKTLKGGRILGPIERVFILAMALGGHYGALSAVVAAKGILRFPEISRDSAGGSRAEYVLVGSFVSWALAFLFVPLF
ncbi:hypothetical protein [Aeromicrobium sp.]|uniref:hypothetical protein n=1 Tax=Aeromicrobium sp. TaxID=1871063 RepID=UPI003C3D06E5